MEMGGGGSTSAAGASGVGAAVQVGWAVTSVPSSAAAACCAVFAAGKEGIVCLLQFSCAGHSSQVSLFRVRVRSVRVRA